MEQCQVHAGEGDHAHGLDRQHEDVNRTLCGRLNQNNRGESTSMVWPTLGSRTAKEQNSLGLPAQKTAKHRAKFG